MRKACCILAVTACCLVGAGEIVCRLIDGLGDSQALAAEGEAVDLAALNYNDDKPLLRRRTPGEFRILTFGDSYCCGTVKPPYTLQGAASRSLAEAGARTRLVNFGEPGSSFAHYRKAMAHWSGRVEADGLMVVVFLGNDPQETAWNAADPDQSVNAVLRACPVSVANDRKRLTAPPHRFGLRLIDYTAALADFVLAGAYVETGAPEPFSPLYAPLPTERYLRQTANFAVAGEVARCGELSKGWQALAELGRDLQRLGRQRRIPTAVVLAPPEVAARPELWREAAAFSGDRPERYDPWLAGRMARAVLGQAAPEVAVLDLTPAFVCAAGRGDILYPPREIHWNVAGNRLAGEVVANFVGRQWLGLPEAALPGGDACVAAAAPPLDDAPVNACLLAAGPVEGGKALAANCPACRVQ